MKARLIPILLLLALLLAACGGEPAESAPSPTEPEETTETAPPAEEHLLPDLDLEEAQAMARFLNANRAFLQDGRLYCYDFGDDWTPALARYTWTKGSLKGFTVLAEGCIPEYLCGDGDYLYYIDRTSGGIERVPETGGERELLRKGPCEGLSLRDGRLYFCDGEGRFLSTDTEGKEETLLLSGPCSFAYPLDRGTGSAGRAAHNAAGVGRRSGAAAGGNGAHGADHPGRGRPHPVDRRSGQALPAGGSGLPDLRLAGRRRPGGHGV